MAEKQTASYGSWKSPITSDLIVQGTISLGQPIVNGEHLYWLEGRPMEGGRMVIVERQPDGSTRNRLPAPYNARSRVHEYGGGAYTVHDSTVYFVNFGDQRIYRVAADENEPQPVTPDGPWRYADLQVDASRQRILCICEDHSDPQREAQNRLVAVSLADGQQTVLAEGYDFYSTPRLSPDGNQLAWLCWDHPNMPWDGTELWSAALDAGGLLQDPHYLVGSAQESIFQPEWSPDGQLYFISDRSGWWNLYRWQSGAAQPVLPMRMECGRPQWGFGMSTYGFLSSTQLACLYTQGGLWQSGVLDLENLSLREVSLSYTALYNLVVHQQQIVLIAGAADQPYSILAVEPHSGEQQVLQRAMTLPVDPAYLSTPQPLEFPTSGGLTAYGLYYPPCNRDFIAPADEKPPLIVISHGGPTSATDPALNLGLQFWTSRGFGVLDVNYGGSTGYGREYRQRLESAWGVVDVDDCANGARYLVESGQADAERLIIRGGSAGGYTTLAALAFRDVFTAGASYFGVSDPAALAQETHKFESRYLDRLIGPYPEAEALYRERAPLYNTAGLQSPVIFFQGLEDRVVPPNQAEKMVAALKENGVPVAYLAFEGEGHGFRAAENIQRALEAELYFYQRVFGLPVDPEIEPVEIINL